jgi:hypothetical protein
VLLRVFGEISGRTITGANANYAGQFSLRVSPIRNPRQSPGASALGHSAGELFALADDMNPALKFVAACLLYAVMALGISLPWALFSGCPFVFADERLVYLDKLLLYCAIYYLPFLTSYFILTRFAGKRLSFSFPAICVYTLIGICLWCSDQYWARGMEVPTRPFYFGLLFIPTITALAVCARCHCRNRRDNFPHVEP